MVSDKIKLFIIVTIIVMTGSFYLLTIREGHAWGGDFSQYIRHARNIVNGNDYKDVNPFFISGPPKLYPPIFPLLLSPIYKWFGLNLTAMKIEIILIFLIFLLMLFFIFRDALPFQYLFAMLVILGLNPFFWDFKDNILSDIPFLFFAYLSLSFIEKAYQYRKPQTPKLSYAIIAGLLIYLSCGTRAVGLVLIPTLFVYDIIKSRKLTKFVIIAVFVSGIFIASQIIFLDFISCYQQRFTINPNIIFHNLLALREIFSIFWENGYGKTFENILVITLSALAIVGYAARIKTGITIFEIFSMLYVILLIIYPLPYEERFLFPVIPLYIFYAFVGLKKFFNIKEMQKFFFIILIVAILGSYAGKYTKMNYGLIEWGIGKKEAIELFDYIRENTEEDAIFVFRKPRVLSLFTERTATVYNFWLYNDKNLWKYLYEIKPDYIIVGQPFSDDHKYLRPFVEKYKNYLEEVYSNPEFKIYKIKYVPSPDIY